MVDKIWNLVEKSLRFVVYKLLRLGVPEESFVGLNRFARFGIVGVSNNLICYVTFLILIRFGLHYTLANIIGFTVSVINSYYWNNKYVFDTDKKRVWWKTFGKTYVSYAGTGILLNNILLALWIEVCGISEVIAPLINLLIVVPINYLINKLWAYKNEK